MAETINLSFQYGRWAEWLDTRSRLDRVKEFNLAQLHAAMKVTGLQVQVRQAVERQIRKLQKEIWS